MTSIVRHIAWAIYGLLILAALQDHNWTVRAVGLAIAALTLIFLAQQIAQHATRHRNSAPQGTTRRPQ